MTRVVFLAVLFSLNAFVGRTHGAAAEVNADLATMLGFESGKPSGFPEPWSGGPRETINTDTDEFHGGRASARIGRTAESPAKFSSLTYAVPMAFGGAQVELRGFVRTKDVIGFAGLWMRQDGDTPGLEFDNMQRRQLRGTTPWTEYSITLPRHPDGKNLYFGFLLSGTGTAWVDDMRLLVDGKPIWDAPKAARAETILDRDHEFDTTSGIALTELKPHQIANLATLGRVWGFLKYHHPVATQGQRHWDYELFRIMPSILAAENEAAAHAVLVEWINSLGKVAGGTRVPLDGPEVHLHPDLRWIEAIAATSPGLGKALHATYSAGPDTGTQFYVSLVGGVKNPVFTRELAYERITGVDAGYQVLALFRFWNIIHYWFPYRDLIEDWDGVLNESVPRVALATSPDAFALEMMAVIARVGDTHANLWSSMRVRPPSGDATVPVAVRFVDGHAVVTAVDSTASGDAATLQRGDVVLAIDGQPVADLVRQWSPFYAASNEPTRLRDIARSLLQGPAGKVRLSVRRGEEPLEIDADRVTKVDPTLTRRPHDLPGPSFRLLSNEVAYLKLSAVKASEAAAYVRQAEGTKGWIIDIRNYPSEFMVFALGKHLVERETEFARCTRPDLAHPGSFSFDDPASLRPEKPRYIGRVVILVDEVSQSSAEYTAMAFRSVPGAIVVGSTTAGADGNVSKIPLPGGLHTMISGIGVFYPDKRPTQRVGIVPDVEVRPTLAGIREGRDEVLEAALRRILGGGVGEDDIRRLASPRE